MGDSQRLVGNQVAPRPSGHRSDFERRIRVGHFRRRRRPAPWTTSRGMGGMWYRHRGLQLLAKPLAEGSGVESVVRKAPVRIMDQAQFSPDGRWIAYNANETDRFEVLRHAFSCQR